jgi:hypothetical protein
MIRRLLLSFALAAVTLVSPAWAVDRVAPSCNDVDVQAAVNASADGDRIVIPAGNCTWTRNVGISKAVKLTGSGTVPSVGAATSGGTTINVNVSAYDVLDLHESAAGHIEVSNLTFVVDSGASAHPQCCVVFFSSTSGGQVVILHHLTFSYHRPNGTAINNAASRGVIYKNLFQNDPPVAPLYLNANGGVRCKLQQDAAAVLWATPSTMGVADSAGTSNLYIEDNVFLNFTGESIDNDDGCRTVIRYNTFDNSSAVSHGHDTSPVGPRHWEFYNNTFICSRAGNIGGWINHRGGSGVMADNILPDITSVCALNSLKPSITMTVQALWRAAAGCYPGPYPWWHQFGWGWTSGGVSSQALEPTYIWNNTKTPGGVASMDPVVFDGLNECGPSAPSSLDYIKSGREYILGAKPNYQKYTYPHPLTSATQSIAAPAPTPIAAPVQTSVPAPSNLQIK